MSDLQRIKASWLFPGDGAPLENATVEIDGDRIAAIHERPDPAAIDLGSSAVIPGLINAHTHLEFSDFNEPPGPADDFTGWIRAVVAHRRYRNRGGRLPAIARGLRESSDAGVVLAGEIATDSDPAPYAEGESATEALVFREIIGLRPEQIDEQTDTARSFLDEVPHRCGLSPHAPYSVHPDLYAALLDLAVERQVPVAVHLAETRDELQLLREGTGPFVELLRDFDAWTEGVFGGLHPLDYLRPLANVDRGLVIHGNYLNDESLQFLSERENLTLVYCPRTHAYFGHDAHPWRKVIADGGRIALGTDSRASNPDLSVWRELQYLDAKNTGITNVELLRLATTDAAEALGAGDRFGNLAVGHRADLAVVRLHDRGSLFAPENDVVATMKSGGWLRPMSGEPLNI